VEAETIFLNTHTNTHTHTHTHTYIYIYTQIYVTYIHKHSKNIFMERYYLFIYFHHNMKHKTVAQCTYVNQLSFSRTQL